MTKKSIQYATQCTFSQPIVGAEIFFDSLGTLVVHHVQCGLVVAHAEDGKYLGDGGDERGVGVAWHGSHNDGVDVVDVRHENRFHIFKQSDGESAHEVGVHGPRVCICKGNKTEHVVHCAGLLCWRHLINLVASCDDVSLVVAGGRSVCMLSLHVSFIRGR